jgi:hypothetical protein
MVESGILIVELNDRYHGWKLAHVLYVYVSYLPRNCLWKALIVQGLFIQYNNNYSNNYMYESTPHPFHAYNYN